MMKTLIRSLLAAASAAALTTSAFAFSVTVTPGSSVESYAGFENDGLLVNALPDSSSPASTAATDLFTFDSASSDWSLDTTSDSLVLKSTNSSLSSFFGFIAQNTILVDFTLSGNGYLSFSSFFSGVLHGMEANLNATLFDNQANELLSIDSTAIGTNYSIGGGKGRFLTAGDYSFAASWGLLPNQFSTAPSFDESTMTGWATLKIESRPDTPTQNVPDTGSTLALLGCGILGLVGIRRKLQR